MAATLELTKLLMVELVIKALRVYFKCKNRDFKCSHSSEK